MSDSTHTLEIEARTRDFASKSLERIGQEGRKAGQEVARSMGEGGTSVERFAQRALELPKGFKKMASAATAAMSSVSAGVALANASSENLGQTAIHTAASIASGFAAGGPVGGALAITSAAVGGLIRLFTAAGDAAKESAEKAAKELGNLVPKANSAAEAIQGIADAAAFERKVAGGKLLGGFDEEAERIAKRYGDLRSQLEGDLTSLSAKVANLGRALSDPDLRGSDRDALAGQYTEALAAVERLRAALGTLNGARRDELAALKDKRELEKREEADKRAEGDAAKAKEKAQALKEQTEAIREQARERVRMAGLDETAKAVDADRQLAQEARRRGLTEEADALERIVARQEAALRAEKARKEAAEQRARVEAEARNIRDEGFTVKMLSARSDAEKLSVRHAQEVANFVGSEAEKRAMILRQEAERLDLARRIREEAEKEAKEKEKASGDYLKAVKEANETLKAELSGTKELLDIQRKLEEARTKGGEAAVEAMKEQIRLSKELTDKEAADAAKKSAPNAGQNAVSTDLKDYDPTSGIGPNAWLRQQKKAKRREEKNRRALASLQAEKGSRVTVGEGEPGLWEWGLTGGEGDMDRKGKKKKGDGEPPFPEAKKGSRDSLLGLPDLDKMGAAANKKGEGPTTTLGDSSIPEDLRGTTDNIKSVADAMKRHEEAVAALKAASEDTAKASNESADAMKESADASKKMAEDTTKTAEAAKQAADNIKDMARAVEKLRDDVNRLKDAANLKGGK